MAQWLDTVRGTLTLDTQTFTAYRDQRDVFFRGFLLIVVISLIAGLPYLVIDTVDGIRGEFSREEMADVTAGFERGLRQALPFMQGIPEDARDEILEQIRQGFALGMGIGQRVAELPTILPKPISAFFQALGAWASRPFAGNRFPLASAAAGTWLGYGIWVMLAAKLLGGQGNLARFFGTTSLFALPHLLRVFEPVPYLGGLLNVIAFIWGAVIYVKATAVSHELTPERALLAVLLPLLTLIILLLLVGLGIGGIVAFLLIAR